MTVRDSSPREVIMGKENDLEKSQIALYELVQAKKSLVLVRAQGTEHVGFYVSELETKLAVAKGLGLAEHEEYATAEAVLHRHRRRAVGELVKRDGRDRPEIVADDTDEGGY